MNRPLRIGSRGSRLAMIQAESVMAELREAHPSLSIHLVKITTRGDRDVRPLSQQKGEGVFVKELEQALLDGRIDVAVHSLKDMPTRIHQDLCLAAVPRRLDPRDVLVTRGEKLRDLPRKARVGTGSPRRAVQLLALRPDLQIVDLRGNVETRLRKVFSDELDGVVLAAAGLARLARTDSVTEYLPTEYFLPAVGQGALGIEIRREDSRTRALVSPLNDEASWSSVLAERTFLREVGGGCRAPIGALGRVEEGKLRLEGMVADPRDNTVLRAYDEGNALEPAEVGARLAEKLLDMGGREVIAQVRGR